MATRNNESLAAWETDAQEYGRWQSGWRSRLLAARNVEKDKGSGQSRSGTDVPLDGPAKVSARAFAEHAHVSHPTVLRAIDYWDEAHAKGAPIPHSTELEPGQDLDLAPVEAWEEAYEEEKEEKEAQPPFTEASNLILSAGEKLLNVRKVPDLTDVDCQDLERPLADLEACVADVREFLSARIQELLQAELAAN